MPATLYGPLTEAFISKNNLDLSALRSSVEATSAVRKKLQNFYTSEPFSKDLDMVVFGSISRNEYNIGSDVDWTLLIDGQADASHVDEAKFIAKKIKSLKLGEPSPTGAFGNVTISHELVHYIGGENDTNQNITRRILLLLESEKVNFSTEISDGTAYSRVVNSVLSQYVNHDSGLLRPGKETIPKFLFNDMVRFWRTMCVDFAQKQKDQKGQKWALRNVKLRMSRKLIFVKGMLMCFSQFKIHDNLKETIVALKDMVSMHPFELMLSLKDHFELEDNHIVNLLNSYNEFLLVLNDEKKREHLHELEMMAAFEDPIYKNVKKVGDEFKHTLDDMFVRKESKLSKLTLKYGIF